MRYPKRLVPYNSRIFTNIQRGLCETDSFSKNTDGAKKLRIVRTPQDEQAFLNDIEKDPDSSCTGNITGIQNVNRQVV